MTQEPKRLDSRAPLERVLAVIEGRLRHDEHIVWSNEPATHLLVLDLFYRAVLWWSIFPCIVPMTADVLIYCALIMAALAYLEFRQRQNRSFYVISNERAFLGVFQRNGEVRIDDCELRNLISVTKSPFTRTIKLNYKEGSKKKSLRFPYVHNPQPAVQLLLKSLSRRP